MTTGAETDTKKACQFENLTKTCRKNEKISAAFAQLQHTRTSNQRGTRTSVLLYTHTCWEAKALQSHHGHMMSREHPAHHSKTFQPPRCSAKTAGAKARPGSQGQAQEPRPGRAYWPQGDQQHQKHILLAKTQLPAISGNDTKSLVSVCVRVCLHAAFTTSSLWGVHIFLSALKQQKETK